MGRKPLVPYGLYRAHGYFNPFLARGTGVNAEDLEALWDALANLFDFDRSAARGEMAVRGPWVFSHDNEKGNAPAHKLFELIKTPEAGGTPRSFEEYVIESPKDGPLETHGFAGVTLTRLI
jgi:CRISPR-associated protein Csd2